MSSRGTRSSTAAEQKRQEDVNKESNMNDSVTEWSVLEETLLLKAICRGLRPVGKCSKG